MPKDSDSTVSRSAFIKDMNGKKQQDDKQDSTANIEDSDNTEPEEDDDSQ